jgi:hypothetical protein
MRGLEVMNKEQAQRSSECRARFAVRLAPECLTPDSIRLIRRPWGSPAIVVAATGGTISCPYQISDSLCPALCAREIVQSLQRVGVVVRSLVEVGLGLRRAS